MGGLIYRAPHLYQLVASDPYGPKNCTAYATARAINAATLGGLVVTGRQVRALSSEPVPDPASPGLNLAQAVAVSIKLRVPLVNRSGEGWDYVVSVLDIVGPGRRVIAQIDHDAWQDKCQTSGHFLHALTLDALRRRNGRMEILGSDPLCRSLRWYRAGNVRDAMAAFTGGDPRRLSFAVTREIPLIAG